MSHHENKMYEELTTALKKWQPSPHCKRCKALAGLLVRTCALYEEAIEKDKKKSLTRHYVDKVLPYLFSLATEVIRHMTKTN